MIICPSARVVTRYSGSPVAARCNTCLLEKKKKQNAKLPAASCKSDSAVPADVISCN